MKIKSLCFGAIAAMVAVSGAQASDSLIPESEMILPEPEIIENAAGCEAAGEGYSLIPGTETCLRVSGHVRYEINIGGPKYKIGRD